MLEVCWTFAGSCKYPITCITLVQFSYVALYALLDRNDNGDNDDIQGGPKMAPFFVHLITSPNIN